MEQTTLKSLEKRVAALEKGLAQLQQPTFGEWKDWRLAIGTFHPTELSEEVDAEGRKIREADRRRAGK